MSNITGTPNSNDEASSVDEIAVTVDENNDNGDELCHGKDIFEAVKEEDVLSVKDNGISPEEFETHATSTVQQNTSSEVGSSSVLESSGTMDYDSDKGVITAAEGTESHETERARTVVESEERESEAVGEESTTLEGAASTIIIQEEALDDIPSGEIPSSNVIESSSAIANADTVDDEEGREEQEDETNQSDEESINEIPPPPPPRAATTSQQQQQQQTPPPPPPPPPSSTRVERPVMDSAKRTTLHHKLRAYEANRRNSHSTKLSSSSLYWKSFRALIHSSLEETKRAEGMIKAHVIADANYALHMKAVFFNFLNNDDGTPLLDHKKRLQQQQQKKDKPESSPLSPFSAKNPAAVSSSGTLLLNTMLDSHLVIADRFDETSNGIKQDILPPLISLREKFEQEVKSHEALGNAILEDLEAADHAVEEAWESYYAIAVKSLSSGTNDSTSSSNARQRRGAGASHSGTNAELALVDLTVRDANEMDVWLAEMKYRVAVAYESALWEKASAELSRLFTRLKEVECQRRFRLADLLHSDMKKRECLFLSLPSILTPSLHEFSNRPMDHASIEDDVQTSIRIRAQQMKKAEVEAKKATNTTTSTGKHADTKRESSPASSALAGIDVSQGKFELTSPLTSELLFKAKVIERKVAGVIFDGWKPSLAVVTVDYFLHFFDIVSGHHKIGCNSAPEVAFHTMLSPITMPTEDNIHSANTGSQLSSHQRAWSNHLSPSLSINLSNSIVSIPDGNSAKPSTSYLLEITETYFNHGASKVFGKTSTRKIQIRTSTREEILDWVACLNAEWQ